MKKRFLMFILAMFCIVGLSSCGGETIANTGNNNSDIEKPNTDNNNKPSDGNNDNPNDDENLDDNPEEQVKSTVTLSYLDMEYLPKNDVSVIWYKSDGTQHSAQMVDGVASISNIDDEYNVKLVNLDALYTYDPNIYKVDPDSPNAVIELSKIIKPRDYGYSINSNTRYKINSDGSYRAELKKAYPKLYYEFSPKESGIYVIESMVSTYDDVINPKLELYTYSTLQLSETIDTGGFTIKGGYTKNFKYVWNVSDENFSTQSGGSVSFIFAIAATNKINETNMTIDFKITLVDDYFSDSTISSMIMPKEYQTARVDSNISTSNNYKLVNADGGTGSYYDSEHTNGTGLLDGTQFKYNEETGYWCKYDPITQTYGPTLVVYISAPCPYFNLSFNHIEDPGNKVLTVNRTENYKKFIEDYYANVCNEDGVCYVTQEMKEFLQKYCTTQKLFIDGEGYIEYYGTYALEEDQWLFACAYYVAN